MFKHKITPAVRALILTILTIFPSNLYAQNPEAEFLNKGAQLAKDGKYSEAVVAFDKAIALNSNYAIAYFDRGLANIKLDELNQAISDFNRAIELKPDYAAAYNGRGIAYAQKQEYPESLSDLLKAKALGFKVNEGLLAAVALTGKSNIAIEIEARIINVDLSNSTLDLFNPLGNAKVKVLSEAVITKDGSSLRLSDLREGDMVVVRLEDKDEEGNYMTKKITFGIKK